MIVLDTHVWLWWVHGDARLPQKYSGWIEREEPDGLGVCAISCWEVALLVARGKIVLPDPMVDWFRQALSHSNIRLLSLSPEVAIEASQLPGSFHRDPADQLIVATARLLDCPLVTLDQKILDYPHVQTSPL